MTCVFVILADNGEVKIGFSDTPYARLSKIKREFAARNGFKEAKLVGFVETYAAQYVESRIFRSLESYLIEGSNWYQIDPEVMLAFILEEAKLVDDHAELVMSKAIA